MLHAPLSFMGIELKHFKDCILNGRMDFMFKLSPKHFVISVGVISFAFWPGCTRTMEEGRTREKLNTDWRFMKGDIENAQAYDFDDSGWRTLDLPHDWAIEGPFTQEVYYQGGYLPYPGVGWYRKTFEIDSEGRSVLLEFDGVMRDAKIWVNGDYVGGWPYGYTSFAFDITNYLKPDQGNVIAVRVENVDNSSRWYPGSGIYRNVWLTITDPVHVAHWGTFVTTPEIIDQEATVKVETRVENLGEQATQIVLETTIVDLDGNVVAVDSRPGQIDASGKLKFEQELVTPNPRRWDVDDPYLYTAITRIKRDGVVIDDYETPFGIRTFRFDADKGFFLNGRSLKMKGVNLHHDLGPLGAAVSSRATERQLEIMQAMGVNAIRTAHNPPSPEQLDLCDRMGILVMDESFDEWRKPKWNVLTSYNIYFDEWAEKDMGALVKRDRNHPSVIMWSTGNEVPELGTEDGKKSAKLLADVCHELDPTRPVSSGIHLSIELDQELMDIFDVAGFNYWHDKLESLHETYPDKPLLVTEASAVLSTRGEYHFPVERIYRKYNHESLQISAYDMINTGFGALPDVEFKLQDDFEWLAGQFVWSGFDYHGEPDPYEDAWPAHSSYFGIVDMCGFPKDRYYLYQSVWTEEPMIHVLPHWNWDGREGEITPVYCYTNGPSAELFVNGKSLGKKEKEAGEYRLKWNDVIYQPGSIRVAGYDVQGKTLCEKEVRTAGKPYQIELIPDRKTIRADGEDMVFVTVRISDEEGNFCPLANNLVSFQIEGEGSTAGVGNGNPVSLESYQANQRQAFHGLCLVMVKSTSRRGEIRLAASSPDLKEDSITIRSK
jgi:beta-galactosidase